MTEEDMGVAYNDSKGKPTPVCNQFWWDGWWVTISGYVVPLLTVVVNMVLMEMMQH